MSTKGRKRKQGKREKNGRLSRVGIGRRVKGSDHAQLMQTLYGQDGCDAIGRAYRSGLLGEGNEAKAMLDMARSIFAAYWATYTHGRITCAIGDKTSGSVISMDSAKAKRREEWLNETLDFVRSQGARYRKPFYQLVIDINPDCGPDWIDRLCFAQRSKAMVVEPMDQTRLDLAIHVLKQLTA